MVSKHPLYRRYQLMIRRCHSEIDPSYKNYGARGITVCDEWRNDFDAYVRDIESLGPQPSPAHSLDRIDNDTGYMLTNIRWASPSEQILNRRPRSDNRRPGRTSIPNLYVSTVDNKVTWSAARTYKGKRQTRKFNSQIEAVAWMVAHLDT